MRSVLVSVALFACSKSEPSKEAPPAPTAPPSPVPAPVPVAVAKPLDAALSVDATSSENAERERIAAKLRLVVDAGLASKVSVAANQLVFEAPLEACDGRHLMSYWKRLKSAGADPAKAFDLFGCGRMGDVIDLHTKDHCPADQTDEVILTDAGDARDRWLEKNANSFFYKLHIPVPVATGCDDTVVSIVNTEDFDCNAEQLQRIKAAIGEQLTPHGFQRLWCQPDGPYLDLK